MYLCFQTSIPEANEELGKLSQTQQLLSPNLRALKAGK